MDIYAYNLTPDHPPPPPHHTHTPLQEFLNGFGKQVEVS